MVLSSITVCRTTSNSSSRNFHRSLHGKNRQLIIYPNEWLIDHRCLHAEVKIALMQYIMHETYPKQDLTGRANTVTINSLSRHISIWISVNRQWMTECIHQSESSGSLKLCVRVQGLKAVCERVSESAEMESACVCVCVDNERSGLGHPCAHHHTIKYSSVLIKQDTGRRSGGTALERPTICKKRNEMGWNVLQSEVSRWTWHQNYCSLTDVSSDMRMMMREDRKWGHVRTDERWENKENV